MYYLNVASFEFSFNISSPLEKRVFYLNFLYLLLGHSFSTAGAKTFSGSQQIRELLETRYQHEPWLPASHIITWQGDTGRVWLVDHSIQPLSACEAVASTAQSTWTDVALP